MPSYPLYCYTTGCKNLAAYKIAARWSDGLQNELKTYGLCCPECLRSWFQQSLAKQRACHLSAGESLDTPGIYHLERGLRDQKLQRLEKLEKEMTA